MKKTVKSILISGVMIVMAATSVFAGQWQSNAHGWWYQNDNDSYPVNGWKWIDGRCYYFDSQGHCLINEVTPDGYTVDGTGAWAVNGVVQYQAQEPVASAWTRSKKSIPKWYTSLTKK